MSDARVYVPTRGTVHYKVVEALLALDVPVALEWSKYGVVLGRNAIVSRFLEGDGDVLVMVDDDTVPHPHFLDGLDALDEHGVLGCPTPLFGFGDGRVTWNFAPPAANGRGVIERDWVGFGVVSIRRDVLERLGPNPFRESTSLRSYPQEVELFCADVREAGFTVGVDLDHPTVHVVDALLGPAAEHAEARQAALV